MMGFWENSKQHEIQPIPGKGGVSYHFREPEVATSRPIAIPFGSVCVCVCVYFNRLSG